MSKCVIAEYQTTAAAKLALEALETEHFTLQNVSVVSSVSDPTAKQLHKLDSDQHQHHLASAPEGKTVSLGMLIGGSIATPIAVGTLIGPLIVVGPLVGIAIGATVGSLLSSTERWGVQHDISADYEQRVRSGSVLIIVSGVDETRLDDAELLLKATDPKSLQRFELTSE
jgi:uncharacterized membrane protein